MVESYAIKLRGRDTSYLGPTRRYTILVIRQLLLHVHMSLMDGFVQDYGRLACDFVYCGRYIPAV
jgi:hypothetical protein